jgi:hypothetical protein
MDELGKELMNRLKIDESSKVWINTVEPGLTQ